MAAPVPRWMFGWAERFADTWGALPAEPILYFFMLTATLQIILTPRPATGAPSATPVWVSDLWRTTGLIAPALCLIAWYMINKRAGRARLAGLWVRFAGDFSQAIALSIFLVLRIANTPVDDDAHVYLMHVVTGVLVFVAMLVMRDVWILLKVEEIAMHLSRLSEDEPPGIST
jgi:hypothetical protein